MYLGHFWQHPQFTAFLHKCLTFNSTVVLQVGLLKHLGNIATVPLDLVCLKLFCFFMSFQTEENEIRSDLCVKHWPLLESLCKQKSHWIITINGRINVWKCKLIVPTDTLQQNIDFFLMAIYAPWGNSEIDFFFLADLRGWNLQYDPFNESGISLIWLV